MNWLNLSIQTLDSPEVIGASPVERATWLFLLRYCIGQENGGRIAGCRAWKDRQWQQVVRVTLREVNADTALWAWDGDDVVITHYPFEKEAEVKTKRGLAAENGKKGGRPPKTTNVGTEEKPTSVISGKAEGERKEKGMELADTHHAHATPAVEVSGYPPPVTLEQAKQAAPQCGIAVEAAEFWWLDHDKRGWVDKQGHRVVNWRSSLTAFGRQWESFDRQRDAELEARRTGVQRRRRGDDIHRPNPNSEHGF